MKGWGPKVRYVPRNQGNQTFLAGYPGNLPGYPSGARKSLRKESLCSIFVPYQSPSTSESGVQKMGVQMLKSAQGKWGRPRRGQAVFNQVPYNPVEKSVNCREVEG